MIWNVESFSEHVRIIKSASLIFSGQLFIVTSLFSVNKFQSRFYDHKCQPINHDPNNLIQTQELEPFFEENSILYIFTKKSFSITNARIGMRPIMFETPMIESIDIDTPSDWDFAFKLKELILKNNND